MAESPAKLPSFREGNAKDWEGDAKTKQRIYHSLVHEFRLREFRGIQEEVIQCAMTENDVFAVFRSGGGKSLCYQLPGVISKGCVLVVMPLISLIEDQVQALRALGIEVLDTRGTGGELVHSFK